MVDYAGMPATQPYQCMVGIVGKQVMFDPDNSYPWYEGSPVWGKPSFNEVDPRPEFNVFRDYMEPIL